MKIEKITISKAPGVIPDTFTDEMFIESSLSKQDDKIDVTNDEWQGDKNIMVFYEKNKCYAFQIIMNQEQFESFQHLRYGSNIDILTDRNQTHKAFVTSFKSQDTENTFFKFVEVEYIDLSTTTYINYFDYVNHPTQLNTIHTELELQNFETDGTTPKPIDANWGTFGNSYKVQSNLSPDLKGNISQATTNNRTGVEVVDFTTIGDLLNLRFYLNKEQKNNIVKYMKLVNVMKVTYDTDTYNYIENIEPTATEIGKDIYRVDISGKINNLNYAHY